MDLMDTKITESCNLSNDFGDKFSLNTPITESTNSGVDLLNTKIDEFDESAPEAYSTTRHDVSIPVPNSTTITTEQHDDAVRALKQSFKEMANVLDMLESSKISNSELTESEQITDLMGDALLESALNGPIFEAVDRSDKETVKQLVDSLRSDIGAYIEDAGYEWIPLTGLKRFLSTTWFATKTWQIAGMVRNIEGPIPELVKGLNKEFKDKLHGYRIATYSMGSRAAATGAQAATGLMFSSVMAGVGSLFKNPGYVLIMIDKPSAKIAAPSKDEQTAMLTAAKDIKPKKKSKKK